MWPWKWLWAGCWQGLCPWEDHSSLNSVWVLGLHLDLRYSGILWLSSVLLNRFYVSCPPSIDPESSSGPTSRIHPRVPSRRGFEGTQMMRCCTYKLDTGLPSSCPHTHNNCLPIHKSPSSDHEKYLLPEAITAVLTGSPELACRASQGLSLMARCVQGPCGHDLRLGFV